MLLWPGFADLVLSREWRQQPEEPDVWFPSYLDARRLAGEAAHHVARFFELALPTLEREAAASASPSARPPRLQLGAPPSRDEADDDARANAADESDNGLSSALTRTLSSAARRDLQIHHICALAHNPPSMSFARVALSAREVKSLSLLATAVPGARLADKAAPVWRAFEERLDALCRGGTTEPPAEAGLELASKDTPYQKAARVASAQRALALSRLDVALASAPGVPPAFLAAAVRARANAVVAFSGCLWAATSSPGADYDRLQALCFLAYVRTWFEPRVDRMLADFGLAQIRPAAAVLEREIGRLRAAAGNIAADKAAELERRARPLVDLAASSSSGGVATLARLRDAIEGIGSPQDCLALARLGGGEAFKRQKFQTCICSNVFCPRTAGENKKKCAGCGSLYYCDAQCQKVAWPTHKHICAILKAAGEAA